MLATVLILAAEAEEGGGIDILIPTTQEWIAAALAFIIVFGTMWKFAWPSLQQTLEDRQKAIAGQIQDAEATKVEAQSLLEDYRAQVANAKAEANEIVEAGRTQGEAVKTDIIAKAEAEGRLILDKAREDAGNEKARALGEARQEVANLSIDLAEKVVGNSLDRPTQQGLVNQYLADLEAGE